MLRDIKFQGLEITKPKIVEKYFDTVNDLELVINFSINVFDKHPCLVMDMFFPNGDVTKTIIDKKANDYINMYIKANGRKRKSQAVLSNMSWYWYSNYAILNKKIAFDYFEIEYGLKNDDLLGKISRFQQKIIDKKKAEKEKPIIDILEAIPFDEVTDAQYKWAVRTQKTNSRAYSENVCCVSFLSKVKGAIIHRHFRIFWNQRIKDYEFYEFGRDVIVNNQIYKYWSPKYSYSWFKGRGMFGYKNFLHSYLYTGNLKSTLKATSFEKSGFYEFAIGCKGYTFQWENYLLAVSRVPQLEKLSKVGLFNISAYIAMNYYYRKKSYHSYKDYYSGYYDNSEFDFSKDNLLGFLKLPNKNYLRLLIERGGSVKSDLSFMQKYSKYGVSVTEADFKDLLNINLYNLTFDFDKAIKTSKKVRISIHKILKYCKNQIIQNKSIKNFYKTLEKNISLYCDYIDFISRMNYDLSINANRYPKNLKKAHDQAYKLYESVKSEISRKHFKAFYEALKPIHNVEIEGYVFKIPSCNDDFIKQGEKQGNCVGRGTYYEEMSEQKSLLAFIDNKQSKESATMEINANGNIVQLRSNGNKDVSKKLKMVSQHYERLLRKHLIFNGVSISTITEQVETISA